MLIVEQLHNHGRVLFEQLGSYGEDGEVLSSVSVKVHPLFKSFRIRPDDRTLNKEHFPAGEWHAPEWKGKGVEPPPEIT